LSNHYRLVKDLARTVQSSVCDKEGSEHPRARRKQREERSLAQPSWRRSQCRSY
jgi:hypothetical protein